VRHETLANLSKLPAEVVTAIESTLKGQSLVPAGCWPSLWMTITGWPFFIEAAEVAVGVVAGLILFVCTVSVTRNW